MIGFWERVAFAFRCFFSILFHADIPHDIAQKLPTPAASVPQAPSPAAPSVSRLREVERPSLETFDRAAQMLALLQRDGRLIDFLTEDITLYPDEQLGAAVRTIHETCRQVLERYLKLEPILNSEEEQPVRERRLSIISEMQQIPSTSPARGTTCRLEECLPLPTVTATNEL